MAEEKKEAPKGAVFTLTVPLDREKTKYATFHMKEMEEEVFMAARTLIDAKKDYDAVRMIIKALHVGGDDVSLLKGNFVAVTSAAKAVLQLCEPLECELKKN